MKIQTSEFGIMIIDLENCKDMLHSTFSEMLTGDNGTVVEYCATQVIVDTLIEICKSMQRSEQNAKFPKRKRLLRNRRKRQ